MNKNTRGRKHNGIALVSVMCAVILMLLLGWGALSLGLRGQIFAVRAGSQVTARCAADAGLTQAIAEMNEKLGPFSFNDSTLPQATDQLLPACNATYSYTVTGDKAAGYTVQSVGSSRNANRQVTATLRLRSLFDFGLLVVESATLYSGTYVDRYNSSDLSETGIPVQVACINPDPASVTLKPGVAIDGEVIFGVDFDFPQISPPPLFNFSNDISVKGSTLTLGPTDSGQYTNITLNNGEKPTLLEIDGGHVDLYITGDIWMGQGCEFRINPGASLHIFLDGDCTTGNSDGINNETKIAANFKLYATGQDQTLELKAKTDTYACVYAPDADLVIKAQNDIYGSIVAKNFENKAKGLIRYDGALSKVDVDDIGVRFVINRWHEE